MLCRDVADSAVVRFLFSEHIWADSSKSAFPS
jgi:hypothetical protein